MMNKKGFTLVELMVVIVIIGVLAAVAIPKFSAATNKAKASEAPTVLSNIVSAEKTYFAEMTTYVTATSANLKGTLGIDIDGKYYSYGAKSSAASTFIGKATLTQDLGSASTGAILAVNGYGAKGATTIELNQLTRSYTGLNAASTIKETTGQ